MSLRLLTIEVHALNSYQFEQLCEDIDTEYRQILLYTDISCPESRSGDFSIKKLRLEAHSSDEEWVAKLAYLRYIFNLLNELNRSLQGKITTVLKLADKVATFKAKLDLWGRRMNRGIFHMFQTFTGILEETEPSLYAPNWSTFTCFCF